MFGGNLDGVTEKLDYLKSLSVKCIYLNPVFEAASNHKYDTGSYRRVDGDFGGEDALKNLIKEAEKRGIKVILDGVFSHTGDDSVYFNRLRKLRFRRGVSVRTQSLFRLVRFQCVSLRLQVLVGN